MTTFNNSYEEFRRVAASFLKKVNEEDLSYESLKAGHKCVVLHFIGIQEDLTDLQEYEARLIIEMCAKPLLEAEAKEMIA